jgi:hypothetical protein
MFGLHAQNIFEMTLSKFRKIYNKNDSKAIGRHVDNIFICLFKIKLIFFF